MPGLGQQIVNLYYANPDKPKGKGVTVSISASCFVPKPFTPFQWEPQDTMEELRAKQKHLVASVTTKKISLSWHEAETSFLEAVFARGIAAYVQSLKKLTAGAVIWTLGRSILISPPGCRCSPIWG